MKKLCPPLNKIWPQHLFKKNMNSAIIFSTPQIVCIAIKNSKNRKTGRVVSLWFLDNRMHPNDSRSSGRDARNQCKGCPLASYNGCYVEPRALAAIHAKLKRGWYPRIQFGSAAWQKFFSGEFIRFGAYGNPSLLPLPMLANIASLSCGWTGYFHDWHLMPREKAQAYGRFLMASTHALTHKLAKTIGLRTFGTGGGDIQTAGSIECLADSKGMTCRQCRLCDGNYRRNGTLPDVWIAPHGYQTKRAMAN